MKVRQFFQAGDFKRRQHQKALIERLRKLTRQVIDLRAEGQTLKANSVELEIEKLKQKLGVTDKAKALTPVEREKKKTELKTKLKKVREI